MLAILKIMMYTMQVVASQHWLTIYVTARTHLPSEWQRSIKSRIGVCLKILSGTATGIGKATFINMFFITPAGVMELVDVVDSKSTDGDIVPVRVRPPAPKKQIPVWVSAFLLCRSDSNRR